MSILDKHPTIIFKQGQSHEVAALILIANFTQGSFERILVSKFDYASFDGIVDAGTVYKHFDTLQPSQFLIIDSLSSFDLEYTCDYTIQFHETDNVRRCKLQFTLDKYGRFKGSREEMLFKEINILGRVIETETK